MSRIKFSEKKKKWAVHSIHGKTIAHGKISIHGVKTAPNSIITAINAQKLDTPKIQVSESITEAQRKRLERSGIKIVAVDDMVKRRSENIAAFRKMLKPGYTFSGETKGKLK